MSELDSLYIQVESDSKKAEEAINNLVKGLENLNSALGKIDFKGFSNFTNAVSKLSQIGNVSNTTSKALRGMSTQIQKSFHIKSADGIKAVNNALNDFYENTKLSSKDSSLSTQKLYADSARALHAVIRDHAVYKNQISDEARLVKEYYDLQKSAGSVFSLKGVKPAFLDPKDFDDLRKSLGSVFSVKDFGGQKGLGYLENFFSGLYEYTKNTKFYEDKDNPLDYVEALRELSKYLDEAKQTTLQYDQATKKEIITGNEAKATILDIAEQLKALVRTQNEMSTEKGLTGLANTFKAIGAVNVPNIMTIAEAVKIIQSNPPTQTAKAVDDIGRAAGDATTKVGALAKSLEVVKGNGFTMRDTEPTKNVQYPPLVVNTSAIDEEAQAFEGKLLPAIIDTENEMANLIQQMTTIASREANYDAVTEKFVEWKTTLMEINGSIGGDKWAIPDTKIDTSSFKEVSSLVYDIDKQLPALSTQFNRFERVASNAARNAAKNMGVVVDNVNSFLNAGFHFPDLGTAIEGSDNVIKEVATSANDASKAIRQAIEYMRDFKQIMSDMESGKVPFFEDIYRDAYKGFNDAQKVVDNFKKSLEQKPTTFVADVVPQLIALGEGLEKLAGKFGALGDKGIQLFKGLVTPLKWFAHEYVEKFESMKARLDGFRQHFEKSMNKMSQFWKRTMKTFTFMLVRKAITAIIKEVSTAIQSLALFSNAMGTQFNRSISLIVADFQYLGRSIVSAAAPVIDYFAPMIDYMVDKIAELISYVGMLFAALTGASTFTRAKKTVDNYAESLDNASKNAKKLTMGIDELNILNDNSSSSGKDYEGWEDAWEQVDVPDWIKELSEKVKGVWDDIFNPLETAWNKAKNQVINGFKTMRNSLKELFGDIGEDFLEVWKQDKTIDMFEQIFKIVGDLERTVRNLANQFDKAWEKGKTGKKILENLRDIASTIVDHARNVSYYMSEWAKNVDFSPVLTAFEKLTKKLKPLADFLGGVFEDIFKVILNYIKFLIEEDIPHLMNTISSIVDAFKFKDLQEKLKPVWDAFEKLFENISIGATNALGALGRELAKFTDSSEFENFLKRIAEITELFTADRVEKVLTGLGEGILKIAEAVVKFVNSDVFIKFLQAIADWIDNASTEQIASILEKIAWAIVGFKFGEFALDKLSGFFQFFTVLTAIKNLGTIAGDLGHLSGRLNDVSGAAKTLNIGTIAEGFGSLGEKVKGLPSMVGEIGTKFLDLHNHIGLIPQLLGSAFTAFKEFNSVKNLVEDITKSIYGQGEGSLNGSVLGLITTVGLASAAFTALLGFPAGIIAAGCVAAAGAIKGILDGVEEVRRVVDEAVIYNAVMTEGEMTVEEVGKWYDQVTEKIFDSVDKWKEKERTLTQDREDINEYTKYIQGLTDALDEYGKVTLGLSGDLVGTYKNLENAIDDYIDSSTDAIKMNLLSQKAYLEAQGYDVNKMIRDLYDTSQAQKDAVHDAVNGIDEAEKKLKEAVEKFGEDSAEAEAAQRAFNDACDAAAGTISQYSDVVGKVDTSEAVKQIEALGKSIDYSQYGSPEEAIAEVKKGIDNVTAAYTEGMAGLKDKQKSEIDEWNRQFAKGMIDEATKNANIQATNRTFGEMQDELTTATQGVLDLYQKDLVNKIDNIAKEAEATWEKDGGALSGLTKAEYVNEKVQDFLDKTLGANGLEGSINKLYEALPGNVNNNAVTAMQTIVNDQWDAYHKSMDGVYSFEKGLQYDMLQGILDESKKLDYDTPASTFASSQMEAYNKHLTQSDYNSLGQLFNNSAGGALLSNKQIFTDKNKLVANEGAAAFSQEYRDFLSNNKETIDALEKTGDTYGKSIVDGLNEAIEKNADSTKSFTNKWFEKINTFIHNNSKMPFGSPNKKTIEYGKEMVEGLNSGVNNNASTSKDVVVSWFTLIDNTIREKMNKINADFNDTWNNILKFEKVDVKGHVNTLFKSVTDEISSQLRTLSTSLSRDKLPALFKETIEPYSTRSKWQIVMDNLLNNVLSPYFKDLKTKFQNFMKSWWTDDVTPYFVKDKWNSLIKTIVDVAESQWKAFSTNWKKNMSDWWKNDVTPYFTESKWKTEFNHVQTAAKSVFDEIKKIIKDTFNEISTSTSSTFSGLKSTISSAFSDIENTLKSTCSDIANAVTNGFSGINSTTEDVFSAVETIITRNMKSAYWSLDGYCDDMISSLNDVIEKIREVSNEMSNIGGSDVVVVNSVSKYATGGFPEYGSLFMAGESGAGVEMVGNVGGKTGVVSNNEITGIADAVYATGNQESDLLGQLVSITQALLDKDPVVLNDKEIALMANRGKNRLGMSIIT